MWWLLSCVRVTLMKNSSHRKQIAVAIRPLTPAHSHAFLTLINALADFEKLKRPSPAARRRLLHDALGKNRRFDSFLAFVHGKPVAYAIIFETYSSFLARPSLYLEDIFVLPDFRSYGIGLQLFKYCLKEARRRRCGRMEWMVLDWNKGAIRFYERIKARRMKEWLLYRIVL